jgi:hypothetical protein
MKIVCRLKIKELCDTFFYDRLVPVGGVDDAEAALKEVHGYLAVHLGIAAQKVVEVRPSITRLPIN